jgi:hypothetical protein
MRVSVAWAIAALLPAVPLAPAQAAEPVEGPGRVVAASSASPFEAAWRRLRVAQLRVSAQRESVPAARARAQECSGQALAPEARGERTGSRMTLYRSCLSGI